MSTVNYLSLFFQQQNSYRSISTAEIHRQTPQMERSHLGAPSCRLKEEKKDDHLMRQLHFCGSDYYSCCCLPLVSPARNCRAWRTRSDQQEADENQGLRELAGDICHIWTFSSNWQNHNTGVTPNRRQKSDVCVKQTRVPTIKVLARPSVRKMLSNKLKKLAAISSRAPGLLWDSSTTLQH